MARLKARRQPVSARPSSARRRSASRSALRGVGLPPGRRRRRVGEADEGLRDAVLGGVGGGAAPGRRRRSTAASSPRRARAKPAGDAGRDAIEVAGAGRARRPRRPRSGPGRWRRRRRARGRAPTAGSGRSWAAAACCRSSSTGDRAVDVAGLQAVQRRATRALGVADDAARPRRRRRGRERRRSSCSLRAVSPTCTVALRPGHRGDGPLALGSGPTLVLVRRGHEREALVDVAGEHERRGRARRRPASGRSRRRCRRRGPAPPRGGRWR